MNSNTVDKKYFGQFYNFLTKDSNPMCSKIQMGIEGNKKQKEGTILMKEIRTEDAVGHILWR